MDLKNTLNRFLHAKPARARFVMPATVFELEPGFVAGARIEKTSGKIRRVSVRELEEGSLVPSAHRSNIAKPEEIGRALHAVAEDLGGAGGPLGLLLPDGTVRVSILNFETLPESSAEREALIRWKLKDVLPFAPEEARLSYEIFPAEAGGRIEVAAFVSRETVLREYESVFEPMNGGVRLLLPATAMLLPLLPRRTEGSDLLMHVSGAALVAVVAAGGRVRLWRHRTLDQAAGSPGEAVAREAARVIASADDHLGIRIDRAWLCARPPATRDLAPGLACAISRDVEILECGPGAGASLSPEERVFLDCYGLTFAGLAANGTV